MKAKNNILKFCLLIVLLALLFGLFNPSKLVFLPEGIRFTLENFITKYFASSAISSINLNTIGAAVLTIIVTWVIAQIVRYLVGCFKFKNKHRETIFQLFGDLCKYVIYIVGWAIALSCFGIDTSAIFASVGVIGIVVGFGAQSLIEDVITGLFIIFEGELQVGDIISIDGFRGTVSKISLRTVSILDPGGNIRIVNNSEISSLVNLSNVQSVAVVKVPVSIEHTIETVEKVITDTLNEIPNLYPDIFPSAPVYQGIEAIEGGNAELLITASVPEENVYVARRIILREVKIAYEKNEITIYIE